MVSSALQKELYEQLGHLTPSRQRQVLDFARTLAATQPQGVPGAKLLEFAGTIDVDDLDLMAQAISQDCEQINSAVKSTRLAARKSSPSNADQGVTRVICTALG